jgi:serine/threonine protein kinase
LNNEELEKAFKELKIMKKLKNRFVVDYIDSWIEEKTSEFKPQSSSDISYSHPIFDPNKTVLLHIQMECCCESLNEVIKQLPNELMGNNSEIMKTLCYFICCELLTEIIECVDYLHRTKIIHRDLKPANILITDGVNGRFVKLADFGLSVIHEFMDQSHTQGPGTSKYKAPEVNVSTKYDFKADIYSLGKIIEDLFFLKNNL